MAITPENAKQLVEQLQHAHRLSVAFYRRFLPRLDEIANKLECQFLNWNPIETARPCRGATRPSSPWAWDFVPLFASKHLYSRTEGNTATPQDVGLSLCLYIDDGFSSQKRKLYNQNDQPDAVTLPIGEAVLQAYVFRPARESTQKFNELLINNISGYPKLCSKLDSGEMQGVHSEMQAIGFEWPLADLIHNHQELVDKLKPYTE